MSAFPQVFRLVSPLAREAAADFALSVTGQTGRVVTATFGYEAKRRTLDQNALYWKWLSLIADKTGYEKDELHELFASMFLPGRPVNLMGRTVTVRSSTKTLKTGEMSEYMARVERFVYAELAGLGIVLPHPELERLDAEDGVLWH